MIYFYLISCIYIFLSLTFPPIILSPLFFISSSLPFLQFSIPLLPPFIFLSSLCLSFLLSSLHTIQKGHNYRASPPHKHRIFLRSSIKTPSCTLYRIQCLISSLRSAVLFWICTLVPAGFPSCGVVVSVAWLLTQAQLHDGFSLSWVSTLAYVSQDACLAACECMCVLYKM